MPGWPDNRLGNEERKVSAPLKTCGQRSGAEKDRKPARCGFCGEFNCQQHKGLEPYAPPEGT